MQISLAVAFRSKFLGMMGELLSKGRMAINMKSPAM